MSSCTSRSLDYDPATGKLHYEQSTMLSTEESDIDASASMPASGPATIAVKSTRKSNSTSAIEAVKNLADAAKAIAEKAP